MTSERIRLLESIGFQWSALRSVPAFCSSSPVTRHDPSTSNTQPAQATSASSNKIFKEEDLSGDSSSRPKKKSRHDAVDQETPTEPAQGLGIEEILASIRRRMAFTPELSPFAASLIARTGLAGLPQMGMPIQSQPFFLSSSHLAAPKHMFPAAAMRSSLGVSPLAYATMLPPQVAMLPLGMAAAPAGLSGQQFFVCDVCGRPFGSCSYVDMNAHRLVCADRSRRSAAAYSVLLMRDREVEQRSNT